MLLKLILIEGQHQNVVIKIGVSLGVLLSIDITYIHFYGKRRKYACGMERDRGTNYGYKYASAVISVAGIRFTLHTVPMTEFTSNEDILEELITEARKYVKIKAVLVDREFSNSPCIKKLEELNVKYLTPVIKHRKKFLQSLRPPCKAEMPLGPKKDQLCVPIIAVKDPDNPNVTLYYATNMDIPLEQLEEIIAVYQKRWTVENAFKSQKLEFLGKTYSINFAIRFFFWVLATLLYNVWILCNLTACIALGLDPSEQERPLITAFLFGVNMRIVFLSPLFDGGELEELLRLVIALVKQYLLKNLPEERIIPVYMMNN
ncbi:MAG: transposase [Theionarchaea archaeon]|nr:transposase [Theionarchaea archaeon]